MGVRESGTDVLTSRHPLADVEILILPSTELVSNGPARSPSKRFVRRLGCVSIRLRALARRNVRRPRYKQPQLQERHRARDVVASLPRIAVHLRVSEQPRQYADDRLD